MEKQKSFIYFPSLSAGGCADFFIKNKEVRPGLTCRFYDKDFPEKWRHPYFLITGGHYYKKMDAREKFGCKKGETLVIGDSGGFQIATGALKWDKDLTAKIFNWLEANSDIAVNLDIPPRVKYEGKFHECLRISVENFKYFEKHQTGQTMFLNVVQGNNLNEYEHWYNQVKDFEFNGWCIGGARKLVDFMAGLAMMLQSGEFEKERIKWVHLLGISKISDFYLLSVLQKQFNHYYGGRIQVSTDSSSPGLYPVYGTYLHSPQLKEMTFTDLYFPKGEKLPYSDNDPIPNPLGHPASDGFTFGDVKEFKGLVPLFMTLNNVFVFNDTIRQVNDLVYVHKELLQTVVPNDFYNVLLSIYEMFENPQHAHQVYEKYKPYYVRYGGQHMTAVNADVLTNFFTMPTA